VIDQPCQPPPRMLKKADKSEPYPVVSGPSAQKFQGMSLALGWTRAAPRSIRY
jgi:hypothetical protein